ncbi:MAG: phage terminase small subunit P27 family [Alphaproteobacteria bacterium]|nr:phage terminase small subunit P27 family [Alphaproteobacteria bacterium]
MVKQAPSGLSAEAKAWWKKIAMDYAITDQAGRLLLETALTAFDRMRQAQALIDKHGAVTPDRFGQLRANPATTIERDSRAAMLHALKALNLDLEPLRDGPGRPSGPHTGPKD